jgi:hypothetical protein
MAIAPDVVGARHPKGGGTCWKSLKDVSTILGKELVNIDLYQPDE